MDGSQVEPRRLFSVAEYYLMAEKGIFRPDERVELIRGVVTCMRRKSREHDITAHLLLDELRPALKGRASVYKGVPLNLPSLDSDPEPDILICSNPDFTTLGTNRTEPLMVIEVVEEPLDFDLETKAALYAEAGVPEYWLVNLRDIELVSFSSPIETRYRVRTESSAGAVVSPLAWPDIELEVSSFIYQPG